MSKPFAETLFPSPATLSYIRTQLQRSRFQETKYGYEGLFKHDMSK